MPRGFGSGSNGDKKQASTPNPSWIAGVFELVAVFAVALVTAGKSLATNDIGFHDETAYLARGLRQADNMWSRFTDGATYSDYYFALSQISQDPIGLYFIGRAGAAVLFVLGVWLAARLLTNSSLAWAAAVVAYAAPAPYVWPSVAAPAAALVLIGLAVTIRFRTPASVGVAAGCYWLAAGSRPEFIWPAIAASAISVAWLATRAIKRTDGSQAASWQSWLTVLLAAVALPVSLIARHGSPFSDGGRNWVAFGQHFSLRNALPGEDSWLAWQTIIERNFPGAESVTGALAANPSAFTSHVSSNALAAPSVLVKNLMGPLSNYPLSGGISFIMFAVLASSMLVSLLLQPSRSLTRTQAICRRAIEKNNRIPLIVVALTLFSIALPVLLVYPRQHYLLVPAGMVLILIVFLQFHVGSLRLAHILPLGLTAVLFVTSATVDLRATINRVSYPPALAHAATALASERENWTLLGVDWGLEVFVPNLTQVDNIIPLDGETFEELIDRNDINAVLINTRFQNATWSETPDFNSFLTDPTTYGFTPIVKNSRIWVRSR